jgi:ferritin
MLSDKMQEALNKQLNAELYSAYLYLAMAAYFESVEMRGMAQWMRVQAEEEKMHGMKFFDFIAERGSRVRLAAIEAPTAEWASPLGAFQAAYAHEQKVTGMINDLMKLAQGEADTATQDFLQWFVEEQEEEEESADAVVQKLKAAGDDREALVRVDKELGQRKAGGEQE